MNKKQLLSLVILRVVVGWHFMYEGIAKFLQPNWTSGMYLEDSSGWFSGFFHHIAANPELLKVVDLMNQYGLLLIGLALISGAFVKIASWGGIALLSLYTLSHPAVIGSQYLMPMEGSYLWIDKNIIEIATLLVICLLPSSQTIGVDRFLKKFLGRLI